MTTPFRQPCRLFAIAASIASITLAFVLVLAASVRIADAQVIIEETTTPPSGAAHATTHPRTHRPKPTGPKTAAHTFSAPKLLWRTLLPHCDGTPAVDGDAVYTTAGDDLYALDSGGHTLALTEIGATQASPLVDSSRLYVGTDRGAVYALDRHSGKPLWKFAGPTDSVLTTPAVGAGRLYVESTDNSVYGLAASTGGQIWRFPRPDGSLGYASPVYVPADTVAIATDATTQQPAFTGGADGLIVCGDATVYRVDPATGHATWHAMVGGKSLSTPAVGGGRVVVGGDGSGLTALSFADGHPLWAFAGKAGPDWFGAPLLADGVVYVVTHNRYVYAVDAATGAQRWGARLLTPGEVTPALDAKRHVLYVTTTTSGDNPTVTALDSRTGAHLWDAKIGPVNGAPTIFGDHLYIGSTSGYFYCYSLR